MLQLIDITKKYDNNNSETIALHDISISFRAAEFVTILGPSGCGKTTLLNIIGGLDQDVEGNMYIEGMSTKRFNDQDWDDYRNQRIGFVFQSYNLIPHQSVLFNVELALTLCGVSKSVRKKRALEALEKVGLRNIANKLPTQLSGGQMQRVAIARAIVNNPDIILADEPTGALDSENSVQVMEILKEISKDKLVIMVTHNPELAIDYSTRIVKFNDGRIIDDNNPYIDKTPLREPSSRNIAKLSLKERIFHRLERKKTKMSMKTAFMLSLKNLYSKKKRTALTSVACSIGIFGIAIVLSLSSGFGNYINQVQEDTLLIYPLTVSKASSDLSGVLNILQTSDEKGIEGQEVQLNNVIAKIVSSVSQTNTANSLVDFKDDLTKELENNTVLKDSIAAIQYDYGAYINIFDEDKKAINPSNFISQLVKEVYSIYSQGEADGSNLVQSLSKGISTLEGGIFSEMLDNHELIENQFTLVDGEWPWQNKIYKDYQEAQKVILIVDSSYCMPDYRMYELGLINDVSVSDVAYSIIDSEKYPLKTTKVNVNDILGKKYKALYKYEYFTKNDNGTYRNKTDDEIKSTLEDKDAGLDLIISGIVKEKPMSDSFSTKTGSLCYSPYLMKDYINKCNNSEIVKAQINDKEINIFTGATYSSEEKDYDRSNLVSYIQSNVETSLIVENEFDYGESIVSNMENKIVSNREYYLNNINDQMTVNLIKKKYDVSSLNELSDDEVKQVIIWAMCNTNKYFISFKEVMDDYFTGSSYEYTKTLIGIYDEDSLSNVKIYCSTFPKKDNIIKYIDRYNEQTPNGRINYEDYIGLVMNTVSNIVTGITMVLIGFASISLIVSCIMIGIITYISVIERKKEIGILRALGATKLNIANVFNAETIIIGAISGGIGNVLTLIMDIPINVVINKFVNVGTVAALPTWGALSLMGVSILLNFISGLIPSQIASQKDPVECLRGE